MFPNQNFVGILWYRRQGITLNPPNHPQLITMVEGHDLYVTELQNCGLHLFTPK
jgi:hypothetical protein